MTSGRQKGFSLVELLTAIVVIAVLSTLTLGAVGRVRTAAQSASCANSLRQLGVATQLYLQDHNHILFPFKESKVEGTLWYFGLEPWGSSGQAEGERELDRAKAPLYPYIQTTGGVEICPSFPYASALWKPKFRGASYAYGYNLYLGWQSALQVARPAETILFADCAQVNTFQAPASASNPMLEEFYMIEKFYRTIHFRHAGHANVLFLDGHVSPMLPCPGTLDPVMPAANLGRLTPTGSSKYLY